MKRVKWSEECFFLGVETILKKNSLMEDDDMRRSTKAFVRA